MTAQNEMTAQSDITAQSEQLPANVRRHLALARDDDQLAALIPDPSVEAALGAAGLSYADAVRTVLEGYASRPALGSRTYDVVVDPETGRAGRAYRPGFDTISYAELHRRVTALAAVLRQRDAYRVGAGDFVCILGFTGTDYATVDLASSFVHGVNVPLQASMGRAALEGIFVDTAPPLVASTVADVVFAAGLVAAQDSVRALLVFDFDERVDDERDAYAAAEAVLAQGGSKARLVTIAELIAEGDELVWEPPPPSAEGLERMAMLLHSSGTTGSPKGAIRSERLAKREFAPSPIPLPLVRLSFAAMNHGMGRSSVYGTLAHGGTTYFVARPDLSTLLEDIRLVRPTDGFFFPRVLELAYQQFRREVTRRAVTGREDEDAVRRQVVAEMRDSFLGDRLCSMIVGGAPATPEVRRFFVEDLGIAFSDRFGATEVGGMTVDGKVNRASVLDYYLRDVPELGYYTTDKPYPRGELCVKTVWMIPGYFKRPEATANLFDDDGFVLTADIVEQRGPDHLVYLGRRNEVLKLAQGEFVAASSLGSTFEDGSEVIHQIFVYGSAHRAYLLAVVVPNVELVRLRLGREPDEADLRALIRAELTTVAVAAGLKSFEVPRDFIVEREPFTQENELLTGIGKRKRPNIHRKYGARLEQLYTELEQRQHDELAALRSPDSDLGILQRVAKALAASLSLDGIDVGSLSSFTELGGDSLGAIAFADLLDDIFGVDVGVGAILSPTGNLQTWTRAIEAGLGDAVARVPDVASVHGKGARVLHAEDLTLEAFIDPAVLAAAPTEPPPAQPHTVLLTGATGFLGRFLCLEWLEHLAPAGGKLICLVRGPDQAAARRRVDACFAGSDERLDKRYRELARDTLDVVVGDIAEVSLGLDQADLARLAGEVERIVHPAALVNHVFDYELLFGPNVAGTAALIGLALTDRLKGIDFVSSGAVSRFLDATAPMDEESPLLDTVTLTPSYADGYGASKWAAEHLLHSASQRFALPINVFRGDMMLPHRSFHEQMNVDDIFTRLLYSVIVTGLAPASFYVPDGDGSRPRAHYDGLPVDYVAAAIAGISATGGSSSDAVSTFNVSNHADDGLSLDVFVDWIEEAGYPIERVHDYDAWLTRFEAELGALPDDKRQLSSLQVLEALRRPSNPRHPARGTRHFDDALAALEIGPETPPLSHDYITKCLDDLIRLGLIPPSRPELRAPTTTPRTLIP